jgi:hypothetical protein
MLLAIGCHVLQPVWWASRHMSNAVCCVRFSVVIETLVQSFHVFTCSAASTMQLLQELSAKSVKGAVLAAVAAAFEDFRCELQQAQQSCITAVPDLNTAVQE